MGPLSLEGLPEPALLLLDSPPIVYWLDGHATLSRRFRPVFEGHDAGRFHFAVTTITLAEVTAGPLRAGDEALAARYRAILEGWRVIALSADIAESAARLRIALRLKLPDAVQAASALAIGADALVTYDRDFAKVTSLRIVS